ncbi:hypothetical protein G6L37_07030 [Agrobacterium rubi]|nr:hypothetical protein [Agrobacterium rubi]NTF25119.1 hypothetical protein [Agrobacterium rubi]
MSRQSFDEYRDLYMSKMTDIPVHNDFVLILDWVKDKPRHETCIAELASVLGGASDPSGDDVGRALGVATILTSWPGAVGTMFFEVISEDGTRYPVEKVPREALEGHVTYVLEATGEIISDLPSRLVPRIRIADFEPSAPPAQAS